MTTLLVDSTGVPSIGRQRASVDAVKAAFVDDSRFSTSSSRCAIWDDFEAGLALLSSAVLVHAAWLGGSFISDKLNPGDLDVVFVINQSDLNHRSAADKQVVDGFQREVYQGPDRPARPHGLLLDSFILPWRPLANLQTRAPGHMPYILGRGYWDDFWCRRRTGAKSDPPVPDDAIPKRGYLEVILNDYCC